MIMEDRQGSMFYMFLFLFYLGGKTIVGDITLVSCWLVDL
jgi:hypothetical protein